MSYFKKISSLEKMASCQVAINLCQDNDFKELATCLEKPTYDVSLWSSSNSSNFKKVKEWDTALEELCERLVERLPQILKQRILVWMNRIALMYSSYSRRQEFLFGVSRYFLMDIFTRGDWASEGRLNEKRLAERLLKDERLTILQRYRIACYYCLHINISYLWYRLSLEEKQSISDSYPTFSQEKNSMVLLWSYYMDGHRDELITGEKNSLWKYAAAEAVRNGNWSALMQCWKRLNKYARKYIREIVLSRALQALKKWKTIHSRHNWREKLVSNLPLEGTESVLHFNLPSYYSELVLFFLSKMCKTQQLGFFKTAFERWGIHASEPAISILECFLEWPLQDYFLPLMNRFWEVIPKIEYAEFLLVLAEKYSESYELDASTPLQFYMKQNHYEYCNLLWKLWEDTPEEFKLFCNKKYERFEYKTTIANCLLAEFSRRISFLEKDYVLFKRVLRDVPQEERKELMLSGSGQGICNFLMNKGEDRSFVFVDWLLEQCLPDVEISNFKKRFIESTTFFCFIDLECDREKHLDDFIDWALTLDTDKINFKRILIERIGVRYFVSHFVKGDFNKIERIINYCLSGDMKVKFKENIVIKTCCSLLKDCAWQQMDECLAWGTDSEEKIEGLKQKIFCSGGFDVHHDLIFVKMQWENVKQFYKWFSLSPEEIIKCKKSTVFSDRVIEDVYQALYGDTEALVASLCWCLTDEGMVVSFKEEIEKQYFYKQKLTKKIKEAKQSLSYLVSRLLYSLNGFKKTVIHERKSRERLRSEQKRSLEDEFCCPKCCKIIKK